MNYAPVPSTAEGTIEVPGHAGLQVALADAVAGPFVPDGLTLTAGGVSGTVLSSLGFGGLVIEGSAQYYLLDFAATQHVAAVNVNDPSQYTVLGVGLRLGFRGVNVSGKAAFSLGALAASASLNATATSFEAATIGVGLDMDSLPFVNALITSSLGTFNVGTLQQLGSAFGQLTQYLTTQGSSVTPKPVGVVLDSDTQLQSIGTSYGYALRAIEGGNSLISAQGKGVHGLPAGVQRIDPVLAATYSSVLDTTDPSAQPSGAQKSYASQLDNCGP